MRRWECYTETASAPGSNAGFAASGRWQRRRCSDCPFTSSAELGAIHLAAKSQVLAPTSCLSFANSPFVTLNFAGFQLETFEDDLLNTPYARASTGLVTGTQIPGSILDSVNGDDGNPTNGKFLGYDSYYSGSGSLGITFTFDANAPSPPNRHTSGPE